MDFKEPTLDVLMKIDISAFNLPYMDSLKAAAKRKSGKYSLFDYLAFVDGNVKLFTKGALKGKFQTFEEFLANLYGIKNPTTK